MYILITGLLSTLTSANTNTCYIVPGISSTSLSAICPNTSSPCVTLSQFVSNPSAYLRNSSHMDLVFLPGYHILQSVLTLKDFDQVLHFGMIGRKFSTGVIIQGEGSARLEFSGIPEVRMEHIKFINLYSSKFDAISDNLLINNCSFIKGNGTAVELEYNGHVSLSNCRFISNIGSPHEVAETAQSNQLYLAGGALYLLENGMILMDGCTFINNSAEVGGVIYAMSSYYHGDGRNAFSFSNCSFLYNNLVPFSQDTSTSYNNGGVFYCEIGTLCSITVARSVFRWNISPPGPSLFAVSSRSTIMIQYSIFAENHGAIINAEQYSKIILLRNNFSQNTAAHSYGGLFQISSCYLKINNCNFIENSLYVEDGGILYSESSSIVTSSSNFKQNYANSTGGIYSLDYQSILVTNQSLYDSNVAKLSGGVLHALRLSSVKAYGNTFVNNSAIEGGVFSFPNGGNLTSHNNSYTNNRATVSGGVFLISNSFLFVCNDSFQHNFAHIGGVIEATGADILIDSCNFTKNTANETGGVGALYIVTFTVNKCVFHANSASDGGAFFVRGVEIDSFINRTAFISNVANDFGAVIYGGSSKLYLYLLQLRNNSASLGVIYCQKCDFLYIEEVIFSSNNGSLFLFNSKVTIEGGTEFSSNLQHASDVLYDEGGAITCIQSELTFKQAIVLINDNYARHGGGLMLLETKVFIISSIISILSNDANVSGGGMYLFQSEIISEGHIFLIENTAVYKGGAMCMIGARVNIPISSFTSQAPPGTIRIIGNTAEEGGGIYFEGNSKLYISKEGPITSEVTKNRKSVFVNNSASYGGAVFIADGTDSGSCSSMSSDSVQSAATECAIQVLSLHDFLTEGYKLPQNFMFSHNSASVSGPDIYGGLIDRCRASFYAEVRQVYKYAKEIDFLGVPYLKNISNVQEDAISSDPVKLCFCINGTQNCSYPHYMISAKKGEKRTVELAAVDQVEHPVNATIHSYLTSESSALGEGQLAQYVADDCSKIEFEISSSRDSEEVILYAEGPCKDIGISKKRLIVSFLPCTCPIGFKEDKAISTRCECICDDVVSSLQATCDITRYSVIRHTNFWLTYVHEQKGYVVYPECPFDYCHSPTKPISINLNLAHGEDAQCQNNRMGKLCGACQPGYSAILGSSKCLPCSMHWIALILVFAFLGMTLVIFVLHLNLTVAIVSINGLMFYANIVIANREIYIPKSTLLSVFISWVNLDLGFDSCLYNGMDNYAKVWLRFLFPLYIIGLVILIIVISERWGRFAKLLTYKNPVATLSTLILLSYTQLLRTIISSFSFAILKYPNGSTRVVWLLDGNIGFFSAKHMPLLLAAILVVIIGLMYTLFLFSWQWILQLNENKMFKWIRNTRLNSFMDAYHAPYHFKYRYWTGLLLFVRVLIYLIASILQNKFADARVNLVFTTILITGICILRGYLKISSLYVNWPVDILELTFYFNIIIFSVATLYVRGSGRGDQNTVAILSLSITFIVFMCIVLYHIHAYCLVKCPIPKRLLTGLRQQIARGLLNRLLDNKVQNIDLEEHLIGPDPQGGLEKLKPTSTTVAIE